MSRTEKDRIELYRHYMSSVNDHFLSGDNIIDKLRQMGFFTAPASTKYHGAYEGGLFDHSANVTQCLLTLTSDLTLWWYKPRSPYVVSMFHDLCKCDQYTPSDDGYSFNTETLLKGHGEKSVMLLSQLFRLTEEEIVCIRYHMGAFTEKEEWGDYTRAVNKYANVLWTHTADMMATHLIESKEKTV